MGERASTIAVVGDVILGDSVNAAAARYGHDSLLGDLTVLREADLAIANLESVVATIGQRAEKSRLAPYHFRGRPETLAVLAAADIDVVGTANNHSGDFGPEALLEQGDFLDSMGLEHAGSGASLRDACAPIYMDAGNGLRVAFFSADATTPEFAAGESTSGTCHFPLDDTMAWRDAFAGPILESRSYAHAVLFAIHWGDDWVTEPSDAKRSLGRELVDMGVHAVLGSNAHVLQGIETHRGGVILHDTAHALTPFAQPTDSAVFTLRLTEDGITGVGVHPIRVVAEGRGARIARGEHRTRILDTVASRSARLGTTFDDDRVDITPGHRSTSPAMPRQLGAPAVRQPPGPSSDPPAACLVTEVPANARIEPIQLGPLTLVGIEVHASRLLLPQIVEVDLYWRTDEEVDENLLMEPRGVRDGTGIDLWLSRHEACDWGWPTSRWQPGAIYLDRAALRPPPAALTMRGAASVLAGPGGPLEISVGIHDGDANVARSRVLAEVDVGLPRWVLVVGLILITLIAVWVALRVRAWGRQRG